MKRALLIVPPFQPLNAPALGVSLLKAAVDRLGIRADLLYCNLRFSAFAGRDFYDRLAQNARALAGD